MNSTTASTPLVRVIEIGCREFLAVGELQVPVDEITAIDLSSARNQGSAVIYARSREVTVHEDLAEALRQFIYGKV